MGGQGGPRPPLGGTTIAYEEKHSRGSRKVLLPH